MLLTLLTAVVLLPVTQTFMGKRVASTLVERFGTNISISHISISPFGYATLKGILALDHRQDTLIYVGHARMSARHLGAVAQGDVNLGKIMLADVVCKITTYKGEEKTNMSQFFKRFKTVEESKKKNNFIAIPSLSMTRANLVINNQNLKDEKKQIFRSLNASIKDFQINAGAIKGDILQLDTQTNWNNTQLTSLSGLYAFSENEMRLTNASIQTQSSTIAIDAVLSYPKNGLKYFSDSVLISVDIKKSLLGAKELKKFIPKWKGVSPKLRGVFNGSLKDFSISDLLYEDEANSLKLSATFKNMFNMENRSFSGSWNLISSDLDELLPEDISLKSRNLINRVGTLTTTGEFRYHDRLYDVSSFFKTNHGNLQLTAVVKTPKKLASYQLALKSNGFDIGAVTAISNLGSSGFDLLLSGDGLDFSASNMRAKGTLRDFEYRDFSYDEVNLEGTVNPSQFNGEMSVIDPVLNLDLQGAIDFATTKRNFSFTADIAHANLSDLGLISKSAQGVFSGSVDLALQGNNIDEMIGDLYIDQGEFKNKDKAYSFSSLSAQSRLLNGIRVININSEDVATGIVIGKFKPSELIKLTQNTFGSQYENYVPHPVDPGQYLDFNFNLRGKITNALFGDAVIINDNTFIKGKIDPSKKIFQLKVRAPEITIKDVLIRDVEAQIDTKNTIYHSFISAKNITTDKASFDDLNWINTRINDTLYGRAEFSSSKRPDKLNQISTTFTIDDASQAALGFKSADVYFNNKHWTIKNAKTPVFRFKNAKQFSLSELTLHSNTSNITAAASQNGDDSFSLGLNFNHVELGDVFPYVENNWDGIADGVLNIEQTENGFSGNSSLIFSNLKLNAVPLGNALLTLKSGEENEKYQMVFKLDKENKEVLSATGTIGLRDQKPILDIDAVFKNYDLSALAGLTKSTFAPLKGNANGSINLFSTSEGLEPDGTLFVDDLNLGIDYLKTEYVFNGKTPFIFSGNEVKVSPSSFTTLGTNQQGTISGSLNHKSFQDWGIDMNINADKLEVLNTKFSEDALYYGDIFFTGDAHLHGPFTNMQIDVIGQTAKGTAIFIPIQYDTAIGDVSYINFVKKERTDEERDAEISTVKGLQMSFDLDVTPDAEVEVVVDPESKSYLRGTGAGNLLLEIDTSGSFAMWGDFIAFKGVYNFKNLGLIDKKFSLKPGGTIVWEGDPYGAQINMQAVYDVPGGANPALLLEGDNISQNIPTEVTINLFGNLLNPETPTFEIDFPNASGVMKNELNYRLNDQERRQLQAISLLSQGSFINEVSLAAISSQTLTNNLFQKASGVFDNIFTSENDKLNFSLNYLQGDRNAAASIKNRDRLGVSLSTNINERILIDGKVGVPVGSEEETTIIGDVKLEFLLNAEGSLRARVFNKENEFQYFGDELGYTQGLGLSYQVRFNSFQELLHKIFGKKNDF